jgi:hypothetical protein
MFANFVRLEDTGEVQVQPATACLYVPDSLCLKTEPVPFRTILRGPPQRFGLTPSSKFASALQDLARSGRKFLLRQADRHGQAGLNHLSRARGRSLRLKTGLNTSARVLVW